MDDLLPIPTEQTTGTSSSANIGQNIQDLIGGNANNKVTVSISHLPEMVHTEFSGLEQRFQFDSIVELSSDSSSFIVKCTLSESLFGNLREKMG